MDGATVIKINVCDLLLTWLLTYLVATLLLTVEFKDSIVAFHNGSVRRAGMAIGNNGSFMILYVYAPAPPTYTTYMVYAV